MHHHHDLKVFSSSTSSNSDLCGPGDPDRLFHRCKFFHWLLTTSNKSNFYVTKVSILHHFRVTYIYFILHRLESASFLLHFVCSERVIDVRSVDNEVLNEHELTCMKHEVNLKETDIVRLTK